MTLERAFECLHDLCDEDYYWAINYGFMAPGKYSCSLCHHRGVKYGNFTGMGATIQEAIDECIRDYSVKKRDLSERMERE